MESLSDRVAVVTGGAGGIGQALCRRFLVEGMRVMVSDVRADAVAQAVAELGALGEVDGMTTDVSDPASVDALAEATYTRFGACHVLCNNAGVGAPSSTPWETTVNDWRWVHGVNVMGVVHGTLAFVPRMLAGGEPGHIVNTSSGDGGIAPLPTASVYAASKAAVSTFTECLASQLESEGTNLRASVFYPSGGLLRTGLWESERTRPPELARERPRTTEPMTVARLEQMAADGGWTLQWQDLDELAALVVDGIKAEKYVFMLGLPAMGHTLRERAAHLERGDLPAHERGPLG
jgi:NAD(P)-dependent dehydrogenase (short-subunit alcohol dehydrogenase family)